MIEKKWTISELLRHEAELREYGMLGYYQCKTVEGEWGERRDASVLFGRPDLEWRPYQSKETDVVKEVKAVLDDVWGFRIYGDVFNGKPNIRITFYDDGELKDVEKIND